MSRRQRPRQTIRAVFLAACTSAAVAAPASAEESLAVATDHGDRRDPRAPEALDRLAFLLGEWKIETKFSYDDGSSSQVTARMKGHFALGGFAIETVNIHPTPADPDTEIFVASTSYVIHPQSGKITAMSINTLGNRKFNEGEFIGGDLYITASGEMFRGSDHISRTRYFNITADRFESSLEVSMDDGATWRDGGYSAVFTRAKT